MNLLEGWPTHNLLLLTLGLTGIVLFIRTQSSYVASQPYTVERRWIFGAFFCNFLLFMLLGGLWIKQIQEPVSMYKVLASRQVASRSDTLAPKSDLRSNNQAYYERSKPANTSKQGGKRAGFILLFGAGILLTLFAARLACTLACAGNGVAAFLIALLGAGVLSGSSFLMSRAFDKTIKPWKQMNRPERKRVYLRSLLIIVGAWAVLTLLGQFIR